jgi:OOP family OmpA-OmpF porin
MRPMPSLLLIVLALTASSCGQNPHLRIEDPLVQQQQAAAINPNPATVGDRDNDGVMDPEDSCPDVPGPVTNRGCPFADAGTNVGLAPPSLDKTDGTVKEAVIDTDLDGVRDAEDVCPEIPGPASNAGCPFPREEEKRILLAAMTSLKFEFDRARILPVSFPALDDLANFLKQYPMTNLSMSGHTDDRGSDAYNMRLSRARVLAVKKYMLRAGISSRRILLGAFGERVPLVNIAGLSGESLESARAKNRRVDMSVRYVKSKKARAR